MSRVRPAEVGARAVGGELVDTWRCGHSPGKYPGGYPAAFLDRAKALFSFEPVLHVCAGGVDEDTRVDLWHDVARPRPDGVRGVRPTVVADGRLLPFKPASFGLVLLDPPWSRAWTRSMYALDEDDYPDPSALLYAALDVVRPGGFVGFLHLHIPPTPPGTRRVARINVVAGNDSSARLRRFTVFQATPAAGEPVQRSSQPVNAPGARTRQRDVGRGPVRPPATLDRWSVA